MPSFKKRILLQNNLDSWKRKFIHVHSIYKDKKLFEYKFTIEGFPKIPSMYVKGAVLDSINGIQKYGKSRKLDGHVEVGYHADGNIAFKDVLNKNKKNFWQRKKVAISKIKKPILFLRVSGFMLEKLEPISIKNLSSEDIKDVIELSNFDDSRMSCDFYFSRYYPDKVSKLSVKDSSPFKNFQTFEFVDNEENIVLHVCFYKSNITKPIVMIPSTGIKAWVFSKYWYYKKGLLGLK